MLKKSKKKVVVEKPPRFPHRWKMKLKHLYDDEYYVATLSVLFYGKGGRPAIIKGRELKKAHWWHERIASYPLVNKEHWTRFMSRKPETTKPKEVEVLLPRRYRSYKGRRMVIFVIPWRYSSMRKRFKLDENYREVVKTQYLI